MGKKFDLRQVLIIAVSVAVLTTAVIMAIFSSMGILGPKYEIRFDPENVSLNSVNKFSRVKEILKKEYYMEVDEDVLLEGAVAGLAEALNDPYTVYFNKEQMQRFMEKSAGSYVGIGIIVSMDENGLLTVVEPIKGSPAEAAGMKQGDKVVSVDRTDVTGIKDENMIISMIKGEENTKVRITVYRAQEGKYIDFEITRKRIKISNIHSEILEGDIGYIKLNMFDSEIAAYFINDLESMLKRGIKGLIIDLRDNPGGSYDQVVAIADRLLPEGLIVYTEDREKKRQEKNSDKRALEITMAVLINGNSASASEILAGAVKDMKAGTLVGTKSFGKGLVQELKILEDGSGIKVTVSRYFTPSGTCIQDIGIEPDIKVELPEDFRNVPVSQVPKERDTQLQTAVKILADKVRGR